MSSPFLDASVIIRLVTRDDPEKQQAARKLLEAVESREQMLVFPNIAIAEEVYVLGSRSLYNLPRSVIERIARDCSFAGYTDAEQGRHG